MNQNYYIAWFFSQESGARYAVTSILHISETENFEEIGFDDFNVQLSVEWITLAVTSSNSNNIFTVQKKSVLFEKSREIRAEMCVSY